MLPVRARAASPLLKVSNHDVPAPLVCFFFLISTDSPTNASNAGFNSPKVMVIGRGSPGGGGFSAGSGSFPERERERAIGKQRCKGMEGNNLLDLIGDRQDAVTKSIAPDQTTCFTGKRFLITVQIGKGNRAATLLLT